MTLDPNTQNRNAYDQIVENYAKRNIKMVPYVLEAAERMLHAMQTSPDLPQQILDLGCGTGRDMRWFEPQGITMAGADLSGGMLREAKQHVQGTLLQADMLDLPYRAACFGGVWCQAALLHLPKAKTPLALAEMYRVLVPGGWLYVAVQLGKTEGFETRTYEPVERYYAHYQKDELSGLVNQAGFDVKQTGEGVERRQWIWVRAQKY